MIPHEVVEAIHKGVHPVRAWRKHKGLTLQELAEAGQMPTGYLSEIETGKKPGSVAAFKSLARALGTEIDMLIAD
jgi:transcriptional regulator with XRE-family HTH domain